MMISNILLSLIAFSPLLAILVLLFIPKQNAGAIKMVGILGALLPLILSLFLVSVFDFNKQEYQFTEHYEWIKFQIPKFQDQLLEINYELGVDGFATTLILLTTIVSFLAAIASVHIKKRWKEYFILFFILEIGMLGVFMSMNLFLFFIFFELTIIPMFFLIGIWGYREKERAAISFLIYNGIGSAAMLVGFVTMFVYAKEINIPALQYIMGHPQVDPTIRFILFLTLFFAFGVKLPIFPLHSWMLKVHVQAPPSIVMIHSGILLKLGAFGLIRLGIGFFPGEVYTYSAIIAILGVINILYGAVLAFVQKDLKMVLAYSSISHMGIVLLGIAALNYSGLQGAIFQVISHGLISALLFFLIGVIYERTNTSMITEMSGLARSMPFISGILLAAAMANLGLPGMSGFVSEFLAFKGLFGVLPWIAAIGVLGIILTAVYLLRAVLNTTFGPTDEKHLELSDAKGFEVIPMVLLLGLIVLIGVYPNLLAEALGLSVDTILQGLWARIGG